MSEQIPATSAASQRLADVPENKSYSRFATVFFPLAMVYHELLLHAFHHTGSFLSWDLVPIVFFALAAGLLVTALLHVLPCKGGRVTGILLTALWTVYVGVSYCCKSYFKIYFSVSYMFSMVGSVTTGFGAEISQIIRESIPFLLLDLIPLVVLIIFRKRIIPCKEAGAKRWSGTCTALCLLAVLCLGGGVSVGMLGAQKARFTYDYNTNDTLPCFGLTATTMLEGVYGVIGMPQAPVVIVPEDPDIVDHPPEITYEANTLDIPFDELAASTEDTTLRAMHTYFDTSNATLKNEYTGLFEGKNLILITAESFSPHVISKELTPTLYELSHNGFVFDNYYQPAWGQSTTGGEFAVMTGLIPTWVNNRVSFYASRNNYMPFALGHQFRNLGYTTLAYHNNSYDYYDRDLTHPNLGYDYYGLGNGLVMDTSVSGPYSDLKMMEGTVDDYLTAYTENGTPFHAYYMTFSGHANWGWGHSMARKNREVVEAAYPEASTMVKAFIAANLELEYALEYLVNRLDEAGALEDTVICLSTDHYPYAMTGEDYDYYPELAGMDVTDRDSECYRSTLIMYCADMTSPVEVSVPCTAVDILPTLSNLFGLEYDARLLSGRDVLAPYSASAVSPSMAIAVIPVENGKSWRTPLGIYESSTRTFTADPGVTVTESYAQRVSDVVESKYTHAKAIIQYDYYRLLFPEAQT